MLGSGGRCSGAALECMKADPSVKLVAMSDVFEDRVKNKRNALAQAMPGRVDCPDEHCFWDFSGYKKVIDLCDVVLIACAPKFHPMYTEAAVQAGKHVFVEKPPAIDPPGIRRMEAACKLAKKKNVSVMSGLQSRRSLPWQDIMKRIHDGEIGEIVALQSRLLRPPHNLVERKPGLTETEYQFSNFYHFCWLVAEGIITSMVHNLDRMTWALQGELPDRAFAAAGRSASFGEIHGDWFDHAAIVYEYKNGTNLCAFWRTSTNCYNDTSDIIVGTKATCYVHQNRFVNRSGGEIYRYRGENNNPYQTTQDEFIKAVKAGSPVNCGDFMCSSTMVGILGQIAAYQGNMVKYSDVYNADFHFGSIKPDEINMKTVPPSFPDKTGNYPIPIPGKTRFM
ncbi:MAG: Gfo/Idh/MocA family oxidoreductase, partial [Planctomycetaceae bacterium]|nr:Gfo/Idh/MocA family oxidoreductase [Planctomycetaceae bacterium]